MAGLKGEVDDSSGSLEMHNLKPRVHCTPSDHAKLDELP